MLELVLPGLVDPETRAIVEAGLAKGTAGDGFTNSPRRAAILRWFSWRRNGFALTKDAAILRRGAIWRELVVVPAARMQSVELSQGPIYRALRLGRVQAHTVAGPISARLGALDVGDASDFFRELSADRRRGGRRRPIASLAVGRVTPAQRSGRLGIGIVGAGQVGPVLGAALGGAGHAIVGINAVSQAARDRADAILPGVPVLDVPAIIERSELVLLAVPGDQLADLVAGLAATGAWQPGQLVAHTAPGFGTAVLAPALAAGAIPLAISPAMAFTGTSIDLIRLRESLVRGHRARSRAADRAGARRRDGRASRSSIAEADRAAYADALAAAASFSTAIVAQAAGALRDLGVDESRPGARTARALGGRERARRG